MIFSGGNLSPVQELISGACSMIFDSALFRPTVSLVCEEAACMV